MAHHKYNWKNTYKNPYFEYYKNEILNNRLKMYNNDYGNKLLILVRIIWNNTQTPYMMGHTYYNSPENSLKIGRFDKYTKYIKVTDLYDIYLENKYNIDQHQNLDF